MNRERKEIGIIYKLLFCIGLATIGSASAFAQVPVDEYGNPVAPLVEGATPESFDDEELPALSVDELETIVGPVALYPDDLLAIVLPASTYPLQIVQAARFLEQLEKDPTLKPDEEWDESVTALLNYPEVVELLNEDIDWTWRLGEAVVAQQADVIAAIEVFRDRAYAAGNLKTDEYQNVSNEDGVIEIEPVNEDVIYVPYYEPERVVVYQPRPVYYYYPRAYPVYYYPYPYGHSFGSSYFWGVTTAFTIGWMTDHLHVHHHSFWGHPYYGHHYNTHFYYRRPSITHFNHYYVNNSQRHWNYRYRDGDYWRPRRHGGARPGHETRRVHYYSDTNRDDWRHRGNDVNRRVQNGASLASNGSNDRRHSRNNRGNDSGDRQARTNSRNNLAPSTASNIRFRQRDRDAVSGNERRRTSFAASNRNSQSTRPSHSTRPANSARQANSTRRTQPSTTNPVNRASNRSSSSSSGSGHERSIRAAINNPRRQVQASPPPRPVQTTPQSRVARASAPSRPQPQRSAAPPTPPRQSTGSNRRSERRSSGSNSRERSSRDGNRSRRRD